MDDEQSFVSVHCFHKAAYKNLNHYLTLQFSSDVTMVASEEIPSY
jgi:hypothetical protein